RQIRGLASANIPRWDVRAARIGADKQRRDTATVIWKGPTATLDKFLHDTAITTDARKGEFRSGSPSRLGITGLETEGTSSMRQCSIRPVGTDRARAPA